MLFAFRIHLIHQLFASNAMSCTMQQLLLHYQIPQYDRQYFPVTGILLITWHRPPLSLAPNNTEPYTTACQRITTHLHTLIAFVFSLNSDLSAISV